jgi:predicted phage terminase large subunit-like protein
LNLTHEDIIAAEREMCSRSLSYFVKRAWHVLEPSTPLKWGWAVDAICEHLEAVTNGDIQNLLATVPPGSMKSLLVSVLWPAWEWGPRDMPQLRYVSASNEEGLAVRDTRKCRTLLKSDWFQSRWEIQFAKDQDGVKEYANTKTGMRWARTFHSITGARGDRLLLDDVLSSKKANSMAELLESRRIFTEDLPDRINDPDKSSIVAVQQRLHELDVPGLILEKSLPYEHLMIPMEFEPDRKCYTSIGWEDPRTKEGELMFPERFSKSAVENLKLQKGSYAYAGQYQQRPGPRGGGIIKDKWWKWWVVQPKVLWRRVYVDTAQKEGQEHDYSVFQCWGMCDDGRIALLDQKRGKWETPDLVRNARTFWNKHRAVQGMGALRQMKVEDKVSGTGLIQTIKKPERLPDGGVIPAIPVAAIQRNRDKVSRANDAAPQIEAGNVLLPQNAEWIDDYVSEFSAFPSGANDDQCDPTFDAIQDMLGAVVKKAAPVGAPSGVLGPSLVEG